LEAGINHHLSKKSSSTSQTPDAIECIQSEDGTAVVSV